MAEIRSGHSPLPVFVLHGGAGPSDPAGPWAKVADRDIVTLARELIESTASSSPIAFVQKGAELLENHPHFNAGLGSALQKDAQARLSAALMDGQEQKFSGIVNISFVKNPSKLALSLQKEPMGRVLSAPGHELLARELGLPVESCHTDERMRSWLENDKLSLGCCDTVGCVVAFREGKLASGTSTGGVGFEYPGRVSDSCTVAGNYASPFCAISATGIGEEIVNDALAARLETRCRDGLSLEHSSAKCYAEAMSLGRGYGWIAVDASFNWSVAYTTTHMVYVVMDIEGRVLASSASV
jgi:L-asparaginase